MVFSSIPSFLDQANWQQQQQQHQQQQQQQQQQTNYESGSGGLGIGHHFHPPPPPPPPPQLNSGGGGGGGTGLIRPGSMSDRARMANMPMPEVALKCPRCESTNTKFCYFNNYSLSQPRHFCKTCRRYWTRGGALRSVPVGGGCRRNKRSSNKASSSSNNNKSSPASSNTSGGPNTNYMNIPSISSCGLAQQFLPPPPRSMGFSSLHNLTADHHYGSVGEIGFNNYGGINFPSPNFFLGNSSSNASAGTSFLSGMEHQWRMPLQTHQFPFLGATNNHGLDIPSHGMFPVHDEAAGSYGGDVRPKMTAEMNQDHDQGGLVKSEMSQDMSMSSSRQYLGSTNQGNIEHQYWTSGTTTSPAWTQLSGFSSSSTSHHPD